MRVAALLPAATDSVIAPGAGDQLVAVTLWVHGRPLL